MIHYYAELRVDGILWYHSRAFPATQFYIHTPLPFIHNYGLTLALAGFITDPEMGYASLFNVTRYRPPSEMLRRYGVYAYPAKVIRAISGEVLTSTSNEGVVVVKGRSRLAYPTFGKNVALMPGSLLETIIVSSKPLPNRFSIRLGAKRFGTAFVRLKEVRPQEAVDEQITHPFNLKDSPGAVGYTVVMPHEAGDIAISGRSRREFRYAVGPPGRRRIIVLPRIRAV